MLIEFIDEEANIEESYENILLLFYEEKIQEDQHELTELLQLLSAISCNHSRSSNFFEKIERIIVLLQDSILKYFSNSEIFNFFKKNKRILLFLSEKKIIKSINDLILTIPNILKQDDYMTYFVYEYDKKISKKYSLSEFEKLRKIGENEDHVCKLIQKDCIDQFITFVNQNNFSLLTTIEYSVFETNSFLIFKNPSLIEYSAFYGSVQIFKYLYLNEVDLTDSLWIYAIHGRNPEIIHILEKEKIKPEDSSYQECLIESIKCHHNDVADYLLSNYFQQNQIDDLYYVPSIFYSNYRFFPVQLTNLFILYHLCKYNFVKIVGILLKSSGIKINNLVILKHLCSFYFNLFVC